MAMGANSAANPEGGAGFGATKGVLSWEIAIGVGTAADPGVGPGRLVVESRVLLRQRGWGGVRVLRPTQREGVEWSVVAGVEKGR